MSFFIWYCNHSIWWILQDI